ncbi:hypothetical protein BS47DRAFT_531784 [Hydnum rufescens UP504]|uniref:Fungal-type protein kinase domain-containing protein n=1 Tax=Hydnum rufescens UP504 TaxID=1448309 RepID=A0A9P6B4Z9_9AGAM|nr:hypothetical protein BS47DRAFT_531784 [Hydnum rufescens UP504]
MPRGQMVTFIYHPQPSLLRDYCALKLPSDQTHWADIVCPMEFKKIDDKANQYDDMWKVVWSMHEIMGSDPLRRFVHGITIEDTTLTTSILSVYCSESPSLGWTSWVGKERIFCTKDEISTYAADAVRGRGTRVWSVYDKTDDPEGKTLFALKDTWVNADRPREGIR